jgi:hypothetical protein
MLATANFTLATFTSLLRSESLRCIRQAVERRWLPSVSEAIVYYFSDIDRRFAYSKDHSEVTVPPETVLTERELLPHLFREEDGYFRWEIVLSPFALTEMETVIEVRLRDPIWTNQIITGQIAFPHEPFQLAGPDLPASWKDGDPFPPVSLPRLRTGSVFPTPAAEPSYNHSQGEPL